MATSDTHDLLGQDLTDDEREVLDLYRRLTTLSRREDLAPSVEANVKQAMVLLWNACNDLMLAVDEPTTD